jgi:protoporphyrinogen/coproporphyrinogen III oxidase
VGGAGGRNRDPSQCGKSDSTAKPDGIPGNAVEAATARGFQGSLEPRECGMATESATRRILIVGGGVSGLAAAIRLVQRQQVGGHSGPPIQIQICESGDQWGGVLQTDYAADGLVERCADMFTTKLPWALELCHAIGFTSELIPTEERRRGALVATPRGAVPVPAGFSLLVPQRWDTLWQSPLLSRRGKWRMWMEPFMALRHRRFGPGSETDESLASFAVRHWGREAFEKLIQPLVSGIFTADPTKLSMDAALPEFTEMERQHVSLVWAARQGARADQQGAQPAVPESTPHLQEALAATSAGESAAQSTGVRYGLFLTPRRGMASWVAAMVAWLRQQGVQFLPRTEVRRVRSSPAGWVAECRSATAVELPTGPYDGVVLAVPTYRAAEIVAEEASELAARLAAIEYASAAIVVSRLDRAQLEERGEKLGFGLVVPSALGSPLIAASFSSQKFPGRCPDDQMVIRSFFGGALHPEHVEWSDEDLIARAWGELGRWIPVTGEPRASEVVRWRRAMPQYHVGHRARIRDIEALVDRLPGLRLAGNAYHGVGIPQCIKSGWDAADALYERAERVSAD